MSGTKRLSEIARHVVQPDGITGTDWLDIAATCNRLGWSFDRWQDGTGRLAFATRADGLYAADTVVVSIPRQVGKTYLFGAAMFALCLLTPGVTVIWTAHRVKTAKETFAAMVGMAERDDVRPHVGHIARSRGDEAIPFKNGSRILFGAREQGFGRGFSDVDVLMFDEAQILTESAMEDMIAAQNVAANPLTILTGTPPRPKDPGEIFTMLRQEALDGETDGTLYVEISADPDAELDDRAQWRKANPSFPDRTPERAMLRMRKHLSDASFRREALGVWDESPIHRAIVSPARWAELVDDGPADDVAPSALAVDMSHDRVIAVAGCWPTATGSHVEVVALDQVPDAFAAAEWLTGNAGRRIPIVVDAASPAASLVPLLKAKRCRVVQTQAPDMVKACGLFYDDVTAGRLSHAGQRQLNDALAGARKRPIRDAGGWGWDRSNAAVNIAPLVAVTLARFGAAVTKKRKASTVDGHRRRVVVV